MRNVPGSMWARYGLTPWSAAAIALVVLSFAQRPAAAQSELTVAIDSPVTGAVLRGVVEIRGSLNSTSFLSGELSFAYLEKTADSWFTIEEFPQPVSNSRLAIWDTTAISDGEYAIKLTLRGLDGTVNEDRVNVQVRNYTSAAVTPPLPSATSAPIVEIDTPVLVRPSATPAKPISRTATPLPDNDAILTRGDVLGGFMRGALAVAAAFVVVGVLLIRRRQ